MAVSIGSLKYDIIADATQFKKGVTATRRELSAAKKVMLDTQTPAEKLGLELRGLEKLYEKGAIDIHTYRRAQDALRRQMKEGELQAKRSKRTFTNFAMSLRGLLVGSSAALAVRSLGRAFVSELEVIDKLAKTSKKLGVTTTGLQALRLAGQEAAGMMDGQVDMAMQRFTRRISEAAAGVGEAKGAIKELGLDAAQLNMMGPVRAFDAVAEAVRNVSSEQDRLRFAFKLFDSEGAAIVNVMKDGKTITKDWTKEIVDLGLAITNLEAQQAQEAIDRMGRVKKEWQSFTRELSTSVFNTVLLNALDQSRRALKELREIRGGNFDGSEAFFTKVRFNTKQGLTSIDMRRQKLDAELKIARELSMAELKRNQHFDEGREILVRRRAELQAERDEQASSTFLDDAFNPQDNRNAWQQVIQGAKDAGMKITDILKGAVMKGLEGVERAKIDAELEGPGPFGDPFERDNSFFGLGEQFNNIVSSIGKLQLDEGTTDVRVANFPDVATRDSRAEFELRKQIAQSQDSMANRQHQEAQQKRTTMADLLAGAVEAIKNIGTGGESFETSGAFKDALADAGNLLEKGFAGSARSSLGDFSGLFQSQENVVEQISKQTTTADQHHAQAQTKREDQKSILQSMLEELQRLSFEAV